MHNGCIHKKDSAMFSLLGRLAVSLVFLMGFSVFAAWAWDRSDKAQTGADVRTTQQAVQSIARDSTQQQ